MAHDVFVSHASQDQSTAEAVCRGLEQNGIHCWIAPRDVVLSRPYAEECVGGIETSTSFLLLASESAISSVQVLSEVEQAHKRRKPIYTILIGKPKVSKELDYYISRLHWIEYAGTSVERLVGQLVKVLSGGQSWSDIASPPSLRRTVLYRRDAFAGSAVATLLAIVLAGAGLAYWRHQQQTRLDLDYRRLGYVALLSVDSSATAVDPQGANVQAQVFLLAHGVPFRDIAFITSVLCPLKFVLSAWRLE